MHRQSSNLSTRLASISLALASLSTAGCGSGTSSTDPGDNSGGTNVTLTITTKAMDAGYIPGVIYAYTGDNIETRAHMPQLLDENNAIAKPFGESQKTVTLSVPKGKYVTLFAAEFGKAGTNAKLNGVVSKLPDATETEFTAWSGATGRLVTSEPGVVSIKMDSDASVTGEFRKLEGVTVQFEGCVDLSFGYTTPAYLGFGTTQPETHTPTGGNTGLNSLAADYFFVYGKQGTTYTFVANNHGTITPGHAITAFLSWGGNASTGSCGGFTCVATIPPAGVSAATLISKNSWLAFTAPTQTIGCGDCDLSLGTCSLHP